MSFAGATCFGRRRYVLAQMPGMSHPVTKTMGVLHIAVGGGAATLVLLAMTRAIGGPIGTATLLLAVVVVALTIGVGTAAGVTVWKERRGGAVSCSSCLRPMTQIGDYRVCANCDGIVARR